MCSAHYTQYRYYYQLLIWFRYFAPKQFYVYKLEDFMKGPEQVLCRIVYVAKANYHRYIQKSSTS